MQIKSSRSHATVAPLPATTLAVGLDQRYLLCAFVYAIGGISLGIYMAASNNHGQLVTHAHVLLVGFVASSLYAIIHKLWLNEAATLLAKTQFFAHQAGAAAMVVGLYALYSATAPVQTLEPLLAAASVTVLVGALLMLLLVVQRLVQPGARRTHANQTRGRSASLSD